MGVTIQFESHRVELAAIYEMEHDAEVLEYYDQPPALKLNYNSGSGKRLGVIHTPDFFVIQTNSASWEECKTEDDLLQLEAHNANRYCRDAQGTWRCPPAEEQATSLGLVIAFAPTAVLTITSNGTFSSWKTISAPIPRQPTTEFEKPCSA